MSVWLVTGASGFVGRSVVTALASSVGDSGSSPPEVVLLGRRRPPAWPAGCFIEADLNDPEALRASLSGISPDYVIHTAGKTPPASDDELYRGNFWATTHLLGALRGLNRPMRVILTGSAAELGNVDPSQLPVGEDYPADPTDAYGRSKLMATRSGQFERPPLEVVCARIFNVIGPGLPPTQAFGAFAERLAEPGSNPLELPTGDLSTRRDFVDVRDVARALIALARRGRAGHIYHVGTGTSRLVGDGLDLLKDLSGRDIVIREDSARLLRPGPRDSRASIDRIVADTGWEPRIPFEQSLSDLWDERLGRAPRAPWRAETGDWSGRLPLTA